MEGKMDTETKVMTQLSYIIARMRKDIKEKIPIDIRKEISKKKNNYFTSVYDNNLPLFEQDLLPDTKAVLSILYSKYICSNEERMKWDEYDRYEKKLLIKKQQELENAKGHYNSDELFKNKKS